MVHKIIQNSKTKRWTVMKQDPSKIGKFGEWKIAGSYPTEAEAKESVS